MLRKRDVEMKLVIQISLMAGNFEVSEYLLEKWPHAFANINLRLDTLTLLHLSLASAYFVPVSEITESEQKYINAVTDILAFSSNFLEVAIDLNETDRLGQTVLHLAAKLGFP